MQPSRGHGAGREHLAAIRSQEDKSFAIPTSGGRGSRALRFHSVTCLPTWPPWALRDHPFPLQSVRHAIVIHNMIRLANVILIFLVYFVFEGSM